MTQFSAHSLEIIASFETGMGNLLLVAHSQMIHRIEFGKSRL